MCAHQDVDIARLVGQAHEQLPYLLSGLGPMCRAHPKDAAARVETHIDGAPRLAPGHAQVDVGDILHGQPGQEGIAIVDGPEHGRPRNHGGPGLPGQVVQDLEPTLGLGLHLLERDHVGAQLPEHLRDPPREAAAVAAIAAMDIVAGQGHTRQIWWSHSTSL